MLTNLMYIFLLFVAFIGSFIVLLIIRYLLSSNKLSTGDTFYHLWISKLLSTNHFRFPTAIPNVEFVDADKNHKYLIYPPLLHLFAALFPIKLHIKIAKIFNIIIVSLLCTIAAIISYNLVPNILVALFTSFIVLFNLSVFEIVSGYTPRPLGLLWYSLIIYVLLFFQVNLLSLVIISLLVMLIALSHKFAIQVLFFVLLPYSLLFGQPLLIISLFLGILLALIFSGGFYLKILREHLKWIIHYQQFPHLAYSSFFNHVKGIFARNTWYLCIFLLPLLFILQNNAAWIINQSYNLLFLALAPLVISILVALPNLAFLGEDYRYIEYGLIPVACLVAISVFLTNNNLLILLFCLFSVIASLFGLRLYRKYLLNSKSLIENEDVTNIYAHLSDHVSGKLMVFPFYRTLEVSYFTSLNFVHLVRVEGSGAELYEMSIRKFGVNYILKFKESYDVKSKRIFDYAMENELIKKVVDFGNSELYEVLNKK